ncbi:MAG: hypothetical protein KKF48_03700 [Nanoarchaeota archaeon]|nr:hypothetical protein [Nanoarchaeota archaeon]MBU1028123.1 hypothetical protein [Nanoarchaeota archaeon]
MEPYYFVRTYTIHPECREHGFIYVSETSIERARHIMDKGNSTSRPWVSSALEEGCSVEDQISTPSTIKNSWALRLKSRTEENLEKITQTLKLPIKDPYFNERYFTYFGECTDLTDYIVVSKKAILRAKNEILPEKTKPIKIHGPHCFDYFYKNCFTKTQISDSLNHKYWSVKIEYENEKDFKELTKILEFPVKNKKIKQREIEHIPRKIPKKNAFTL